MTTNTNTTLPQIETLTRKFADAREELGDLVRAMQDKIDQIERANLPRLKELVARAASREADLRAAVESAPDLFERPRTVIFHGVKVGYQKGKGLLVIPDPDRTVEKIKTHLDCPENYIRTEETPDKVALAQLPVADLRRLGCEITDTGDQIVIRAVNGEVEKVVNALLKKATAATLAAASNN